MKIRKLYKCLKFLDLSIKMTNDDQILDEIEKKKKKLNLKEMLNRKDLNEYELDMLMNQAS